MRTLTRAVRGLLALALLFVVVGGVPWFLAASLGIPFPRPLPTSLSQAGPWLAVWRIDRVHFVLDLLGIVGWCYWAAFVRQLVVQIPGALADATAIARDTAPAVRRRRTGPAASLVAVLLTALAWSVATSRTPAAATADFSTPVKPSVSVTVPAVPTALAAKTVVVVSTYTVTDGDTLWDIAARRLGDAQRWREIYDLNSATLQNDGQRLSDPNVILPGWVLTLPETKAVAEAAPQAPVHTLPQGPEPISLPVAPPESEAVAGTSASLSSPDPGARTTRTINDSGSKTRAREVVAQPKAHRDRSFVDLPDGGMVGIGLASTLAAAIALTRKRHRIRTTARWPIPMDTAQPLIPEPVAAIERAHLATLAPPALGYFQDGDLDPEDDDPYLSGLDCAEPVQAAMNTPEATIAAPDAGFQSGLTGPSIPASYAEFTASGSLSFGTDGDREIGLDLRAHAGLGLTGPGASNAARALLLGLLANGGPLASLDHMRVLIPSSDLTLLLDGGFPVVPRLDVMADLDEAIDRLEAEYLDRRRVLSALGVPDAASVRRYYAEQTMEPLVLIATPELAATPRLAALLEVGRTVDLHAILLGPWEAGTTAEIDEEGHTRCDDECLADVSAFALASTEAGALMAQLYPTVATEEDEGPAPSHESITEPVAKPDYQDGKQTENTAPRLTTVPTQQTEVTKFPLLPRVVVNVLGPVTVTVDGRVVVLNNKETSILTFLALHPAGTSRDEIIAALWTNPDGSNNGSPETFRSTVYHARTRIRAATGDAKKMYIASRGTRYLLDPADIGTDLAVFTKHLDAANRARNEVDRIAALEAAVDSYRGQLASGIYADWLIIDREAESRRFSDACARLADLTVDSRPEFALHILERAVADSDCNQELYAKIMQIQALLGRHAEMWKTLRLLEVRLAALDDEPDRNMYELANRLTSQGAGRAG
jgi:DNA-binding SARP family transcriptional activator/LysM repeat protein